MSRPIVLHVAFPLLAPLVLVGLYFTPLELIGCVDRGVAALCVALGAAVAAVVTAGRAARAKKRDDRSERWWLASTILLLLPAVLLVWPLG